MIPIDKDKLELWGSKPLKHCILAKNDLTAHPCGKLSGFSAGARQSLPAGPHPIAYGQSHGPILSLDFPWPQTSLELNEKKEPATCQNLFPSASSAPDMWDLSPPSALPKWATSVLCVDNDEAKVKTLREGGVPIFEDHLPELLARHLNRGVKFTSDLASAVEQSEAVFIAVGTPQGDTGAADLSYVEAVVSQIARSISSYKVIVEKSTVPVYTNEWIRRVLVRHGVDPQNFDVVSNPEFLREGTAVLDFLHPDRIVVGAGNDRAADVLRRIYEPLSVGT